MSASKKQTILVVDDTAVNRMVLSDILSDEYEVIEARDGLEALNILHRKEGQIALMLLDVVMPNMDGFEVLALLHRNQWSANVPVIIISAETSSTYIRKGFELGAVDYVNRPFDPEVVLQRVRNTITLFAKQGILRDLVADQVAEREKTNTLMVDILSTIVEFRNGESGLHVTRIRIITELLLEAMQHRFPEYDLTPSKIANISNAAALHDIGKIAIPEEILNKPGRLTPEEFDVIKTHSAVGDAMLEGLHFGKDEELVGYAREICRWHHERWDGKGYPDGLVGDQIPVAAQAVALADVYDALVSERVYKAAYSHEKAIAMIEGGECGAFNPDLMQCFVDEADNLNDMIAIRSDNAAKLFDVDQLSSELIERKSPGLSDKTISLLKRERTKLVLFSDMTEGVLFDYDYESDTVLFSGRDSSRYGYPQIMAGSEQKSLAEMSRGPCVMLIREYLEAMKPSGSMLNLNADYVFPDGVRRSCEIRSTVMWCEDEEECRKLGVLGRILPVGDLQ